MKTVRAGSCSASSFALRNKMMFCFTHRGEAALGAQEFLIERRLNREGSFCSLFVCLQEIRNRARDRRGGKCLTHDCGRTLFSGEQRDTLLGRAKQQRSVAEAHCCNRAPVAESDRGEHSKFRRVFAWCAEAGAAQALERPRRRHNQSDNQEQSAECARKQAYCTGRAGRWLLTLIGQKQAPVIG